MSELGKTFREKIRFKKIGKNSKHQSEIASCEQKTIETPFSHYFKIRAKKFYAAKPLAFQLHFLFLRDQNKYSNLTSKIMNENV